MALLKLLAMSLPDLPPLPMHPPSQFVFPQRKFGKKTNSEVIVPGFLVFHVALDALPMQLQMTLLPTIKTQTGPIWEVQ